MPQLSPMHWIFMLMLIWFFSMLMSSVNWWLSMNPFNLSPTNTMYQSNNWHW